MMTILTAYGNTKLVIIGDDSNWLNLVYTAQTWCALTGNTAAEQTYAPTPHKNLQHPLCMVDGETVVY